MQFQLEQAIEVLERTPATLSALLKGLSHEWTSANEGDDTWSAYDVLGHLIHGEETDWIVRARVILDYGESKPFQPFDRFAQFERSKGKSLDELLREFETLRKNNIDALNQLSINQARLDERGTHPALGSVTLGQLLATWVAHDLDHIAQIVRVMSKQYAEAVGPWKQYLSIITAKGSK